MIQTEGNSQKESFLCPLPFCSNLELGGKKESISCGQGALLNNVGIGITHI